MANDWGVDPWNRLELTRPVCTIMRPRDPGGLVGFPFLGHAIAERGGGLRKLVEILGHGLDHEPLRDGRIGIHPAIAPERPVAADVFDACEIHFSDQNFFFLVRGLRDYLSEGISDERSAPELQTFARRLVAANITGLETDAIRDRDINSVGDCV